MIQLAFLCGLLLPLSSGAATSPQRLAAALLTTASLFTVLWNAVFLLILLARKARQQAACLNEQLHVLFREGPEAVSLSRLEDGTFVNVNPRFEQLSGWRSSDILGRSSKEIGFWARIDDRTDLVLEIKTGKKVENRGYALRRRNGTVFRGILSATAVRWNDIPHLCIVFREEEEKATEWNRLLVPQEAAWKRPLPQPTMILICSDCRRVHVRDGKWEFLESYLSRSTGIRFSHDLCPECMKRMVQGTF
jgi:PAS domain S-box-containing protein